MAHLILFILYFFALCLVITRLRLFADCIKPVYLVWLFGIHVAAGCVHNWIAFRFYPNHGDLWYYFEESLIMKQELLNHPQQFFNNLFFSGSGFNISDTKQPLLDIQYQILQYINVFLNFFSFNNLYINTLIFSFPVFAGTVALFKVFYTVFHKPLAACCALLIPSVIFWTSVLYKDGIFFMALGIFCYCLLPVHKHAVRRILILTVCLTVILLSRTNAVITLFPALIFVLLTRKKWLKNSVALGITLVAVASAVIIVNRIMPNGLLHAVYERQKDFQLLAGGSRIYLPVLEPSAGGVLKGLPVALLNGFFQPLPGVGGKLLYAFFSAELVIVWAMVLCAGWLLVTKKTGRFTNIDIACLLFALPGMVIIGYMVPFAGAIIRYRSIYLPFLLAPFMHVIGSYPLSFIQSMNNWLYRHAMVPQHAATPS